MEAIRRVHQLWNWIPAFRAVAETEHLPTAAKQMHVSASALSRTVRLLEDDLGVPLFHREGRHLRLNAAGERFLTGTRQAMRLVHEAVLSVREEHMVGKLRIASAGLITEPFVVPALQVLLNEFEGLHVQLVNVPADRVVTALSRGEIDASFQSVPLEHPRVRTELLGYESNGIYCGQTHPLHSREKVSLQDLSHHAFTSPPPDPLGRTYEGWPHTIARTVRLHSGQLHWGLEACALGELLAVLPDVIGSRDTRLCRLPLDILPPTPMYAITRPNLGSQGRAERVVAEVKKQLDRGTTAGSKEAR